jgi:formate-dependent nitrite reductase membrane component NrfD
VPVIHKAHWKWLVIVYFFLGGIAGGAQVIAAAASLVGGSSGRQVARAARYVSFLAFLPCPPLLILDLGRPERFLHMLRVLKLRSPMSVGTWVLVLFGPVVALASAQQAAADGLLPPRARQLLPTVKPPLLNLLGALCGALLASYTGVLLGATAVPVWTRRASLLASLFAASALSAAAAAVALMHGLLGHRHDRRLARFEQTSGLIEAGLLLAWFAGLGRSGRPLQHGRRAALFRHGVAGAGIAAPLVLGALAGAVPRGGGVLSLAAALLTLAGGFLLRYLIVVAGHASADDPEATFEMTRRRADLNDA